jgi:hypothetical protein
VDVGVNKKIYSCKAETKQYGVLHKLFSPLKKIFYAKLKCGACCVHSDLSMAQGGRGRIGVVKPGLLTAEALWVPSDVIRIVFSLLMSSFLGGPISPPAVGEKVARTPWGRGLNSMPHMENSIYLFIWNMKKDAESRQSVND